jgi:hypothetical protein
VGRGWLQAAGSGALELQSGADLKPEPTVLPLPLVNLDVPLLGWGGGGGGQTRAGTWIRLARPS